MKVLSLDRVDIEEVLAKEKRACGRNETGPMLIKLFDIGCDTKNKPNGVRLAQAPNLCLTTPIACPR